MTPNNPLRISRTGKTERVSVASRLASIRCPECGAILPLRHTLGTNPLYGEKWADAHACANCETLLRLSGEGRVTRFFLLHVPVFLIVVAIISAIMIRIDFLSTYNVAREQVEPTFFGLVIMMLVFVGPVQTALLRFERVEVI